jgi:hypothetical protein
MQDSECRVSTCAPLRQSLTSSSPPKLPNNHPQLTCCVLHAAPQNVFVPTGTCRLNPSHAPRSPSNTVLKIFICTLNTSPERTRRAHLCVAAGFRAHLRQILDQATLNEFHRPPLFLLSPTLLAVRPSISILLLLPAPLPLLSFLACAAAASFLPSALSFLVPPAALACINEPRIDLFGLDVRVR